MGPLIVIVANLVQTLISLYIWVFIVGAVLSWLAAFNVINTRSQAVDMVMTVCDRLTAPALRPIRRVLPNLGGIDISPVIAILLLEALSQVIFAYVIRPAGAYL